MTMKGTFSRELELRKTPARYIIDLARILEICQGWKDLMTVIPNLDDPSNPKLKYDSEHVSLIEEGSRREGNRSCSEILLDEWGTSGRVRPRLGDVLALLTEAKLYRAADFVAQTLLNEKELDRPIEGPSAKIEIPVPEEYGTTPTAPGRSSNVLITPTAPGEPFEHTTSETAHQVTTGYSCQGDVTRRVCQELSRKLEEIPGVRTFSYADLLSATSGFSDSVLLGKGGFGSVYLAALEPIGQLAVKKLLSDEAVVPGLAGDQFSNELLIVAGLSHPNILNLLGYSCDGPDLCLVYPYLVNGSLQDRLECKGNKPALTWPRRHRIARETAMGLCYLHSQRPKPLVHRDIKSANVLLGSDFNVKIGDFGLVRHGASGSNQSVAMTSTVLGTSAYMAPEAFRGDVSVKMDVFSFGVVMLELVTGLPPLDEDREEGADLASYVEEIDDFNRLVDGKLQLNDHLPAKRMFDLARLCLIEKKNRPPMPSVLETLNSF